MALVIQQGIRKKDWGTTRECIAAYNLTLYASPVIACHKILNAKGRQNWK